MALALTHSLHRNRFIRGILSDAIGRSLVAVVPRILLSSSTRTSSSWAAGSPASLRHTGKNDLSWTVYCLLGQEGAGI